MEVSVLLPVIIASPITLVIAIVTTIFVIVSTAYSLINRVVGFTAGISAWNTLTLIFVQNAIRTFFVTFTFTGGWIKFVVRRAFTIADALALGVIEAKMW